MSRIAKAAGVALGTGAVVISGAGLAMADAGAEAKAIGSPGALSGNVIQVPIHVPINLCGNTVNIIALLNPTFGNECVNGHKRGKDDHDHKGDDGHKRGKDDHGHNGDDGHKDVNGSHGPKGHHASKGHKAPKGYGN